MIKLQDQLKKIELFRGSSDSSIRTLAQYSTVMTAEKGSMLFVHEDVADRFYLIQRGWVKLYRETLDGAQAVVDILTAGHLFGETSIFQDDIYPYSAEIAETSSLISIPLRFLKKEIESNPKTAAAMLSSMARYRKQQDQELEHRTLQNAPQRIGCFLLRLADQNDTGRPVSIHLPYDKTLVASRLGMQPETFSRALNKLKQTTDIQIKGGTIEINSLEKLVQYSCAACSSEFPCKDIQNSAA